MAIVLSYSPRAWEDESTDTTREIKGGGLQEVTLAKQHAGHIEPVGI